SELELGFCEPITNTAVKNITQHLSNLKYLGLKNCVNISKEALDMLDPDLDIDKVKSVINEAIVKDNISKAGTANAISSQEFCKKLKATIDLQELRESIEIATKSLTVQQNTIGVIYNIRRQILDKKKSEFLFTNYWR
ncbi:22175_t:CDS:2, partial [Gigaspora margarita]